MDIKYLKNILFYLLSAILSIGIVVYILYHLFNGFEVEIETQTALYTTQEKKITLDAYVMREETVLSAGNNGGINYLCSEGEKVGVNTVVANIYSGGSGNAVRNQVIAIDRKIELLEKSNIPNNLLVSDTNTVDGDISATYLSIRDKIENNQLSYAIRKKDSWLTLLNKRQIIRKITTDYNAQIAQLQAEKMELTSKLDNITGTVQTADSGYFYAEIDGYEQIFSSKKVTTLTVDDFQQMQTSSPDLSLLENGVGKIVTNFSWYLACEITKDQLRNFIKGDSYPVIFSYSGDEKITMNLERIVSQTDDNRVILLFQSGIIYPNFNFLRKQTVEIVQKTYAGYKVPIAAVRIIDGVQGVYVLNGNTIHFKEITPLLEQDGNFIVATQPTSLEEPDTYYKKLGLYDEIIIQGKDLYDGKIIE